MTTSRTAIVIGGDGWLVACDQRSTVRHDHRLTLARLPDFFL